MAGENEVANQSETVDPFAVQIVALVVTERTSALEQAAKLCEEMAEVISIDLVKKIRSGQAEREFQYEQAARHESLLVAGQRIRALKGGGS